MKTIKAGVIFIEFEPNRASRVQFDDYGMQRGKGEAAEGMLIVKCVFTFWYLNQIKGQGGWSDFFLEVFDMLESKLCCEIAVDVVGTYLRNVRVFSFSHSMIFYR